MNTKHQIDSRAGKGVCGGRRVGGGMADATFTYLIHVLRKSRKYLVGEIICSGNR